MPQHNILVKKLSVPDLKLGCMSMSLMLVLHPCDPIEKGALWLLNFMAESIWRCPSVTGLHVSQAGQDWERPSTVAGASSHFSVYPASLYLSQISLGIMGDCAISDSLQAIIAIGTIQRNSCVQQMLSAQLRMLLTV